MIIANVNASFGFGDGLVVSLFSMSVVFVVLLILYFTILLFSKLVGSSAPEAVLAPAGVASNIVEDDTEEQLVAKIVSGCLAQDGSGKNIVIKSIKRVK